MRQKGSHELHSSADYSRPQPVIRVMPRNADLQPELMPPRRRQCLFAALCVLGAAAEAQGLPHTIATYDPPAYMDLLYEPRAVSVPAAQRERLFSFLAKMPEQFSGDCVEKTWLVIGYAGRDEDDAQSLALLSRARAENTKVLLVRAGIDGEKIKVEWFGASRPVAQTGDARNRRTEIEYAVCSRPSPK